MMNALIIKGKAGRTRYAGQRPHVRGSVMNLTSPHGGGEGKPVGLPSPLSPWGKETVGRRPVHTKLVQTSSLFVVGSAVILVNIYIRSNTRGGTLNGS